jgi:Aminopeptidase N
MAIVHLSTPLQPGTQIEITTPFRVKIPHNGVSRLGHYMNSYQITQWYPKPAVYDHKGWHHMPYLTQGEFYSEFGSFDVSITVPENYVVGATGNLQTESEKQFIENKVSKAPAIIDSLSQLKQSKIVKENQLWNPVIPSSNQWKTVRYTLDNIHDFAFFAEKGYIVRSGSVTLPHSGREVQLYAMYYPSNYKIWNNSIDYLRDAVYYYSLWNGDYPYDVCTAVDGAIAAGGGMEYPTITVIGNCSDTTELDLVIAHEVGHNWFYGILGSNERQHGWMDEGVNSFNEMRYMDLKYPNYNTLESIIDARFIGNRFHLNHHQLNRLSAAVIQQLSIHQVLNTHSSDFQSINYGVDMYQRTAISLGYLQTYLGEQLFDQCMQTYYERWKFKHPYPEDMQKVFEEVSGKPLNWFFKDLIETRAITDYTIRSVKTRMVRLRLKSEILDNSKVPRLFT